GEKCSDGGFVMCRIMPPVCGDGKVLAAVNGCYKCLFEKTCTCNDGSDPVCPSPVPNCPEGTELAVQNQCHVCASPWTCEPVE
ncbi:MAG: hypothetical protein FJ088_05150, partial [Deltaproteobacteria bacterium]|nr:hypothetical protein [Deltaproteobacteria bacterium]